MKKKFREVHIWINSEHLIYKIKVISKDGDIYDLALSNIRLNEALPEGHFDTTIPEGYQMSDRMEFIFGAGVSF